MFHKVTAVVKNSYIMKILSYAMSVKDILAKKVQKG